MRASALVTLALLSATPLRAQAPQPGCDGSDYAAFDFWLGDWDVTTPDGKSAGRNVISREEDGCLVVERWRSVNGGTGQSYNYFDPATGAWRQVWVSAGFTIDYSGGLNDDGEMVLQGKISYRNGAQAPFRGTWTAMGPNRVRQHFEQFNAEKGEWTPLFTGLYDRRHE
ncbi:MAG: hypothetical protein ACFB00_09335 [Parvularculaceae bacterium]